MKSEVAREATPIGPFVQGLVAAVALGSMASTSASSTQSAVTLAAGMGLLAAVFGLASWVHWWAGFFYSAIGLLDFIPTALAFMRASDCSGLPSAPFRIACCVLLVAAAGLAAFASIVSFGGKLTPAVGLGLLGGLQVIIAASTFLASGHSGPDWLVFVVLIPGAVVLGWLLVRATDAVLAVAGITLGLQTIYAVSLGSACSIANLSGATLIVGFCVAYFISRTIARIFIRR